MNKIQKNIKEAYIDVQLKDLKIFSEVNKLYKNIELVEFKMHFENGNILKHKDGTIYGIAIFNAIEEKSIFKIQKFLKTPNLKPEELSEFIEKLKLKKYIAGSTKKYSYWQSGDIGNAFFKFDKFKKVFIIDGFANHTALKRIKPVR